MSSASDGSTINGYNLTENYFYSAVGRAAGTTTRNGILDYDGTVQAQGISGLSGAITNLGNGFFNLTPSGGSPTTYQILGSTSDGQNLVFESNTQRGSNTGPYFILSNSGTTPPSGNLNYDGNNSYSAPTPGVTCFVAGTRVATDLEDREVENLSNGDRVRLSSGEFRTIKWLGHRAIDCARHPRPHEVMPIRIAAHAFGENRPSRNLRVSPGHAICVDAVGEVLIPAGALVNGTTILQEQVGTITYWHVELEGGHDIILAENMPCESYIEMGNRSFFAEAGATMLHASPDARVVTHADFCRPFHQDGPVVAFVRERLAARSPDLGWTLKEEPFANLHLLVDGLRVEAETNGLTARFLVPACAKEVWLCSDTSVPAEIGMTLDLRPLGVCVGSLVFDDGFGTPRVIAADHPLLNVGFHNIEEGPQRWTAGRSRLPSELWKSCLGSFFLRVELTRPALPRWLAPSSADQGKQSIAS